VECCALWRLAAVCFCVVMGINLGLWATKKPPGGDREANLFTAARWRNLYPQFHT
jgi:hypothetical protein